MEHMKEHGQAVGEELVLVDLKILLIFEPLCSLYLNALALYTEFFYRYTLGRSFREDTRRRPQ
jgi:hypothetical protein